MQSETCVSLLFTPRLQHPNVDRLICHEPEKNSVIPKPVTKFDGPENLPTRIVPMHLEPAVVHRQSKAMSLALRQITRTRAQIRPLEFNPSKCIEMATLRFLRIARTKAMLLFTFADGRKERFGDALPQPVDASLRMLPGTRHRKSHV